MTTPSANKWIWQIARPDFGRVLLLSVLSGLSSAVTVVFALFTRRVVDIATGDAQGDLWIYIGCLFAVLALQIALDVFNSQWSARVSGKMEMRIKERVFAAIFRKRWQDVSRFHSGELVNRLSSDSHVVVSGVVGFMPRLVSLVTRLIACLAVLLVLDARFTLIMFAFGLLLLIASRAYGKKVKTLHKECQETDGKAKSFTQESFENWTMIQAFEGGDHVRGRLADRLKTHFRAHIRRNRWSSASHGVMHLLFSGSYYAALAWGAVRLAAGTISYGTLTAFLQIVGQIRMPFMNMSGLMPQYYNMLASAERLIELEDLPDEPRACAALDPRETLFEALEVADVHFAYEEEHPILTGASLSVRRGEFIALSGYSGIGKSTLFKLMLGFYTPQSGTLTAVTADGRYPLGASTRGLFAYVPQQSVLLSGTIRENIAFCCPEVTEEAIWVAAETAAIADVIRALPNGLDTPLGERGAGLSEGQLQRLAIARAVLCDAPILLLDEVTASLDEATEEQVLRNLRRLTDKTCLCISHRPAALEVCDRIIRVEDGKFLS